MNLYINSAKENWVVDRFIKEFKEFDKIRTTKLLFNADLIWIIAPWTWRKIPIKYLIQLFENFFNFNLEMN